MSCKWKPQRVGQKGQLETQETERTPLCSLHGHRKWLAGKMTRMATRTTNTPQSMQRFAKQSFVRLNLIYHT